MLNNLPSYQGLQRRQYPEAKQNPLIFEWWVIETYKVFINLIGFKWWVIGVEHILQHYAKT